MKKVNQPKHARVLQVSLLDEYNILDENEDFVAEVANKKMAKNIVKAVNENAGLHKLIEDILECAQGSGKSEDFDIANRLKVHEIKTMIANYKLGA